MAIAATNLTNDATTTDGIVFTPASVSCTAGCGYLFSFAVLCSTSSQPYVFQFASSGVVFTPIGNVDFDTVPATQGTLFVYGGVAPVSGTLTISVTMPFTCHAFAWSIDEFSGVDPDTPFPQWVGREDNTTPETTGTLGTMVDSNSRSFVALAKNTNTASVYTMDTNWALLAEANVGSPTLHLTTCWSDADGAATSASFTQSTGSQTAGNIIVEIANNPGTNVTVTALPGAFSFAGSVPLVSVTGGDIDISPLPGAFSFAGTPPSVSATTDVTVTAPAGQFSFGATAPTLEGTLTPEDGFTGGPSLAAGGGTWGYLSAATEKSLKER